MIEVMNPKAAMTPTLNFLVEHIGANQTAFTMTEAANRLVEERDIQVNVFYESLQQPCRRHRFPVLNIINGWAQQGITIATTLMLAHDLVNFPGPRFKFYYLWDIGWLLNPQKLNTYGELDIMYSDEIEIITRCEDHGRVLENNFGIIPSFSFDNFDYDGIVGLIKNCNKRLEKK